MEAAKSRADIEARIDSVLNSGGLSMVYQPIFEMVHGRISGVESLARFAAEPIRSPDVWFDEASRFGRGVVLELEAIKLALSAVRQLGSEVYVSVNASPKSIMSDNLSNLLVGVPLDRVVLEVTEHAAVLEYRSLADALAPLRDRGLRIAIDDAGAGHASFRHILNLAPDIIKLDMSLTRSIDSDHSRRALAAALIAFAKETNSTVIAEGVETDAELSVLRQLGVSAAQGYLLGKPMPISHWAPHLSRPASQQVARRPRNLPRATVS